MFKKSVSSICSQFTAQLEKVVADAETTYDVSSVRRDAAEADMVAATNEITQGNKAIENIRSMFGVS